MPIHASRACTPVPRRAIPEDFWSFVMESIDKVLEIAKIIINHDKAATPFCRSLYGVLWSIKEHLKRQSQAQDDTQKKKVESFLNNLERLCNWPRSNRYNTNRWPTLKALKFASYKENAIKCLQSFATDSKTDQDRADIVEKLKSFSAKSLKNEMALVAQSGRDMTTPRPPHVSHKLDHDIEYLYNILKQYRSCKQKGFHGKIRANIRLNGYKSLIPDSSSVESNVNNASTQFGVLFLDHPHTQQCYWQEACIQICHTGSSAVPPEQFAGEKPQSSTSDLAMVPTKRELIPCESFCQHISSRNQDLLQLSTRNKAFVFHKRSEVSRDWLAGREAVPLGSILTKPGLNLYDKSKRILAMLVAQATWHFYDSDVIGQGLTSNSVYFLCEQRLGINGVFINEPMLLTRFVEDADEETNAGMIHEIPKILALGILLLELETRKTMENHRKTPKVCPPGPVNINTDYRIAKNLIDTGPNAHPASIISDIDPRSPLKTVLQLCIKSGALENKLKQDLSARKKNNALSQISAENALRSVIYSEIVEPLEIWARDYDDHDKVKPLYEVEDLLVIPRLAPPPVTPQPAPQTGPTNLEDLELRKESRKWFYKYDELKDVLQPKDGDPEGAYKRVRVAVLDTGINQDYYDYLRNYPGPLEYSYKDFVNVALEDTTCDNSGHGTAAISLLVAMCPSASLYIARVLESKVAKLEDIDNIVKAIEWAILKEVDIITMAIGFQNVQDLVKKAIERAHSHGILIFSAASNERNANPVYCPAILTDHVFGIFSTDAGGRESRSLNPSPVDQDSFAIFGENVEVDERLPLVKGTSYSTSIAAGLAAALLDFSRQELDAPDAPDLSKLKDRRRMKRMFREMVSHDNKFSCIQPWKLLSSDLKFKSCGTRDHVRKKQRRWIRGNIERVLPEDKLHELQKG